LQGPAGASEAINVSYDNSTSGLDADNVQDAIDEIVAEGVPSGAVIKGVSIFETDSGGDLMPITDIENRICMFDLDINGELMPADNVGMFEIDVNGELMPMADVIADRYFEVDNNDNLVPK